MSIAADTLYDVAFIPSWDDGEVIGHITVRRIDDRVTAVSLPVTFQRI